MIRFLFILILPFTLWASQILSYNIYDRTDRVDVMITFDIPYSGVIKQNISNSNIIIKLEDATIESSKIKQLSSNFLKALTITPAAGYVQIIASVPPSIILKASKTSDAYGLRLRFIKKPAIASSTQIKSVSNNTNPLALLPTKSDDDMSKSYYMVVAILIIGIIILLLIRKKVTTSKQEKQSSWLFKKDKETNSSNSATIRFQKSIDANNSVVMLDFGPQSYFLLMGTNNILLDKFTENRPATQEDFETILKSRNRELDDFMHEEDKEPIQVYKEKAAFISYGS